MAVIEGEADSGEKLRDVLRRRQNGRIKNREKMGREKRGGDDGYSVAGSSRTEVPLKQGGMEKAWWVVGLRERIQEREKETDRTNSGGRG